MVIEAEKSKKWIYFLQRENLLQAKLKKTSPQMLGVTWLNVSAVPMMQIVTLISASEMNSISEL